MRWYWCAGFRPQSKKRGGDHDAQARRSLRLRCFTGEFVPAKRSRRPNQVRVALLARCFGSNSAAMIVLFTDFGLAGPYTGQMTTVLQREAPGVPVISLFAD